jgi:prephenate dehydrogenase
MTRVLVVGTGLIGASIGLALRDHADVLLDDRDAGHLADAVRRGAGRPRGQDEPVDLAVVCVPPGSTPKALEALLRSGLATTVSHVASAQSQVQDEVEALLGGDDQGARQALCGGHPLAGRETRGPGGATGRLFLDRPWALCPSSATGRAAVDAVRWLAESCGAVPVEMSASAHDEAVALVSHLPQLAASALAARLLRAEDAQRRSGVAQALAGPGLQDTTRIAASDPDLWLDILRSNAGHVAPLVRELATDLAAVAEALDQLHAAPTQGAVESRDAAAGVVHDVLSRGRRGRATVPLKRGAAERALSSVLVSVPDTPGQLAGALVCAAEAGVNVEDVHVEHLPGRPRGLLELVVATADQTAARSALGAAGWDVLDA